MSVCGKEYALNNAIASVEMEGYNISEYERYICMEVLNGNITTKQFIQIMLERSKGVL